ncbi:outer membrane beta-barrel protein [Xanthobacter autotrophicus]|uniref:outer membrane protein n=1 Tax=Xanthobacter TaxID=279 RepID=UPI0024AC1EDD|nr:outer membrane beta-barrel protein [Xanthobacter autotrophicus]MDI4664286.1 outer membrane beta-barrel protein [Xanthobacter autotrophicus]
MIFRALLLATAFLAPLPALAADLAVKVPAPPPPVFSWTGFYIGTNAGYAWSDGGYSFKATDGGSGGFGGALVAGAFPATGVSQGDGFTIGGQVGFNYQTGRTVFGVEADLNWLDYGTRTAFTYTDLPSYVPFATVTRRSMDYFGTVRARAGFTPVERLLAYVTAGVAFGNPSASFTINAPEGRPPLAMADSDEAKLGYALGAGAEYAFTDHWTLKTEYLYYDFGDARTSASYDYGVSSSLTGVAATAGSILRGGVNYKF